MKYLTITLLSCLGLLITGCSTSQPLILATNKPNYERSFKTTFVRTNFRYSLGGWGNSAAIQYQARASCKSKTCESPRIVLSFFLQSGSSQVQLGNQRSLSINTDDKKYHWSREAGNVQYNLASKAGHIITVKIKKTVLKQIAESKKVSGLLVSQHFKWTYKNRKALRALLKKLENTM